MRKCKKCEQEKPLGDYYQHNGRPLGKCKECVSMAVRENRKRNFDHYSQYEKKRYQENEQRRKKLQEGARKWREKNPVAYRAQTAVSNAVRDGRLEKKDCLFCETDKHVHAHHNDYSKPLDVVWLCAKCHHRMHANFPEVEGHSGVTA